MYLRNRLIARLCVFAIMIVCMCVCGVWKKKKPNKPPTAKRLLNGMNARRVDNARANNINN